MQTVYLPAMLRIALQAGGWGYRGSKRYTTGVAYVSDSQLFRTNAGKISGHSTD